MLNLKQPKHQVNMGAELTEKYKSTILTQLLEIVPWNAIGLALLLFVVGGGLLAIGILIKIGTITSEVK